MSEYRSSLTSFVRIFMSMQIAVLVVVVVAGCSSSSEKTNSVGATVSETDRIRIPYNYKDLKVLDIDQMSQMLFEKVDEYKKQDRLQALKEGALMAFTRPNEDSILDKYISNVRTPLDDNGEWESTLQTMVSQSIATLESSGSTGVEQVNAAIVLENILSEIKPLFLKQYESGGLETRLVEQMAASSMLLSEKAIQERKLNQMKNTVLVNKMAQRLLQIKKQKIEGEK